MASTPRPAAATPTNSRPRKKQIKGRNQPTVQLICSADEPQDPQVLRDIGVRCLLRGNMYGLYDKLPQVFQIGDITSIKHWLFVHAPNLSNAGLDEVDAATQQLGVRVPTVAKHNMFELTAPLTELGRCQISRSTSRNWFRRGGSMPGLEDFLEKPEAVTKKSRGPKEEEFTGPLALADLVPSEHLLEFVGYPKAGIKLDAKPGTGRAFALDCEMVLSGDKRLLARIAVLDFETEAVLLDTFVMPTEPITDYVTRFSGITPELLRGVTTNLEEVQKWLRENVGASDILIGHSLESDLGVLNVFHSCCVDTALVYPHARGLPKRNSLKWLANKYLGLQIQEPPTPDRLGHDPTEDSLACLKLVKLKLEKGPEFGNTKIKIPVSRYLSLFGIQSAIVGQGVPYWDGYGTAHIISVDNDSACVAKSLQALESSGFVFATLDDSDTTTVGRSISTLITDAPPQTLITIWNSLGDLTEIKELDAKERSSKRNRGMGENEDLWTDADKKRRNEADKEARSGLAFVQFSAKSLASGATDGGSDSSAIPNGKAAIGEAIPT